MISEYIPGNNPASFNVVVQSSTGGSEAVVSAVAPTAATLPFDSLFVCSEPIDAIPATLEACSKAESGFFPHAEEGRDIFAPQEQPK
jgi:hypothetical protein